MENERPVEQSDLEEPQATADEQADTHLGPDGQPVGPDNIREGTVRGTLGGPNPQEGQGQGG